MLEPAPEAGHEAFLLRTCTRRMIGDAAEMRALGTDQAADQGDEGIEVAFAMASGPRLKELHDACFYGTMAAMRVTHGAPPDCTVIHMEEHTRAGTYPYFSLHVLYGSEIYGEIYH